jgi:hypothetical protein
VLYLVIHQSPATPEFVSNLKELYRGAVWDVQPLTTWLVQPPPEIGESAALLEVLKDVEGFDKEAGSLFITELGDRIAGENTITSTKAIIELYKHQQHPGGVEWS